MPFSTVNGISTTCCFCEIDPGTRMLQRQIAREVSNKQILFRIIGIPLC